MIAARPNLMKITIRRPKGMSMSVTRVRWNGCHNSAADCLAALAPSTLMQLAGSGPADFHRIAQMASQQA